MGSWSQTRNRTRAISGMWMVKVRVSSHTGLNPAGQTGHTVGNRLSKGLPHSRRHRAQGHSSSNDNPIVSVIRCDRSASRIALKTKRVCLGAGRDTQASPEIDTDIDTDGFELLHKGDLRTIWLKDNVGNNSCPSPLTCLSPHQKFCLGSRNYLLKYNNLISPDKMLCYLESNNRH